MLSIIKKGQPFPFIWTDEKRKAQSEWRIKLHREHPECHPNRRLANNRSKMSYPEKVAFDFLTSLGIVFEHQKKIGRYYPDFVIGDLIIEIDGAQWHDSIRDSKRDEELNNLGFKIFRIDSKQHIENEIQKILGV